MTFIANIVNVTMIFIIIFSINITMIFTRADMKDLASFCLDAAPVELDQTFGRQCWEVLIVIRMRIADYQETSISRWRWPSSPPWPPLQWPPSGSGSSAPPSSTPPSPSLTRSWSSSLSSSIVSFFIWLLSSTLTSSSFSGDCLDQFCLASGSWHLDKETLAGEVAPGESQVTFIKYGRCPKQ